MEDSNKMSRMNSQERVNNRISQNNRKLPIPAIAAGVVVVSIMVGIAIYVVLGMKDKPIDPSSYNMVVTEENVDEVLANMKDSEKTPIGSYEVNMNTTWTFDDSSSPAKDAIIRNSTTNSNVVFFTIALKDGAQIFKSPQLPIGSSLKNIVLDKQLAAGTYPAVVTYHLLDDKNNETSTVSVNLTIIIGH